MHLAYVKVTFSGVASIPLIFWLVLVIQLTYFHKCGRFHKLEPEPKEWDPPDLCACVWPERTLIYQEYIRKVLAILQSNILARALPNLGPSYLSHMIAAAT